MLFVKHIVLLSTYRRMATKTLLGATKPRLEQKAAATVKKQQSAQQAYDLDKSGAAAVLT